MTPIKTDMERVDKVPGVSWRSAFALIWRLLAAVGAAIATLAAAVAYGKYDAHRCAVNYPHDGQCGLAAGMDELLGLFVAVAVLIVGAFAALVRWAKRQTLSGEAK